MDITKVSPTFSLAELKSAAERAVTSIREEGVKRKADTMMTETSIKTGLNFYAWVLKMLHAPVIPPAPAETKQSRFANSLPIELRSLIHFHETSWWFWSGGSRVGPYDTEDLAGEGLTHYLDHTVGKEKE